MYKFYGEHILLEIIGVSQNKLNNEEVLLELMTKAVEKSGATILPNGIYKYKFDSGGITLTIALSESHATIHTYPEYGKAFVDCFTCGDTCKPLNFAQYIIEKIEPKKFNLQEIKRGE